jgi:D-alanine-D-alanine ligase
MRIGITFDLKTDLPIGLDVPDDWQEEFDSPATVETIAAVLRAMGHQAVILGDGPGLLRQLLSDPPDFVFNLAEGQGISRSREARVPAVLEMLGIPHTGSDPLTLAVTLDKDCAKRLVAGECPSLRVPAGCVVPPGATPDPGLLPPFPLIAKPAWEGSSKGIRGTCLVRSPHELPAVVGQLHRDHRQPVLLEEFIAGDELTVGVVGNSPPQVIGVMRVVPLAEDASRPFLYSLEVKRDWERQVRYEVPPPYPPETIARLNRAALEAYRALGCRDVCRIDFRLHPERGPVFLEANPLPGLNPDYSDLVLLARGAGWTYERLITTIVEEALRR